MFVNPRGHVLLVNNEKFPEELSKYRHGSAMDENNLTMLFQQLYFKVTVRRNRTYREMVSDVMWFANLPEHQDMQMAILIVLTHGEDGYLMGSDGLRLPIEWVLLKFNNDQCPNLKGKPKFFIFQACR